MKSEPRLVMDKVYHCALDDTINILEEITQKADGLKSIFDVEVMALLRQFHEKYGAKFSLYLFFEKTNGFDLRQVPERFRAQWRQNADWLKMSFHSKTRKPEDVHYYTYEEADYQTAKDDFDMIKREILRFAGPEVWDNYPRTHFWSGSKEAVRAWRDCGIDGLFYSYPGYPAMYFDDAKLKELQAMDFWYDREMGMLFLPTNIKLPCLTVEEVKKDLVASEGRRVIEIFCDDHNLQELWEHMDTAIRWAVEHGYQPAFYEEAFSWNTP